MKYILFVLCILTMACSSPAVDFDGTDEEREYDALQLKGNWESIVEKSRSHQPTSLACRKVACLARYRLGLSGREAVYESLADSREVLSSELSAMMMSDVYMQLGMVNMAQRAAFEAHVVMKDALHARVLRRLTETALITSQYDLVRKYATLLSRYSKHREWASSMRQMADHPELISRWPVYQKLKLSYEKNEDQFFY